MPVQDDLVFVPSKLASSLANVGPLALCTRVTNAVTLMDPDSLRSAAMEVRG